MAKPPDSWPEIALVSYQPKNYPAVSSGGMHVQPTLAQKEDRPSERNWKVSSKGSRDVDGSSMKLPSVGVKLVSYLSGHVDQVRQPAVYRPRHCAVHLTGSLRCSLKTKSLSEKALCASSYTLDWAGKTITPNSRRKRPSTEEALVETALC